MIRLFTDTAANLTEELIEENNLTVIPFSYTIDGVPQQYSGMHDFDSEKFYSALRSGAKIQTSMINIVTFILRFEEALKAGEDVIYIALSGAVSGSYNSADIAAKELRETYPDRKIEIVNSYGAGLGLGLLVLKTAKMIKEGKSFEEVVEGIYQLRPKICQYFTVDDLKHLKRGGRLSNLEAAVGILLNIKPLLTGDATGHIVAIGKLRGRNAALNTLADKYDKLVKDRSEPIYICHGDDLDGANALVELLRKKGFTGEPVIVIYEPVCGTHVGPGAMALFFEGIEK